MAASVLLMAIGVVTLFLPGLISPQPMLVFMAALTGQGLILSYSLFAALRPPPSRIR